MGARNFGEIQTVHNFVSVFKWRYFNSWIQVYTEFLGSAQKKPLTTHTKMRDKKKLSHRKPITSSREMKSILSFSFVYQTLNILIPTFKRNNPFFPNKNSFYCSMADINIWSWKHIIFQGVKNEQYVFFFLST